MDADSMPCRRCKAVTAGPVVIYGPDRAGKLKPQAAQCRDGCPRDSAAGTGRNRAQRTRTRGREEVIV